LLKLKNEIKHIPYNSYSKTGPLHIAALNGNFEIVSFLIKCGLNINALDNDNATPLYYACINKHEKVALLIKENSGMVSCKDLGSLMCTLAVNKEIGTIKLLYTCGTNIMTPDYNKRTVAHIAAAEGEIDIIEFLINSELNVIVSDRWGKTPLDDCPEGIREMILTKYPESR
jgi:ankyrin repeat protein